MKETRFTESLGAVDIDEYESLNELMNSHYLNKNERVLQLWNYIFLSRKIAGEYTPEELARAAFVDSEFTQANFRMVISEFVKLIEKFLIDKTYEEKKIRNEQDLLDVCSSLRLAKSYVNHLRKFRDLIKNTVHQDADYYNNLYLFYSELFKSASLTERHKYFDEMNVNMDLSFIAAKLDAITKSAIIGSNVKGINLFKEVIGFVEKRKNDIKKNHPVIYSRYLIVMLFTSEEDGSKKIFRELEAYSNTCKNDLVLVKYNIDAMLTYCRKNEMAKKEFELVLQLDKLDLIAPGGIPVNPLQLVQIVDAGLAANRLNDVMNLYNKYKTSRPPESRREVERKKSVC